MSKTGEESAKEARETAKVLRMSDYKPKSASPTFPRFRKHQETERPPYPGGNSKVRSATRMIFLRSTSKLNALAMWAPKTILNE